MSWINSYQPPTPVTIPESELYGPDPFDVNFVWRIRPEVLETKRVKLVPFVPRVHAEHFWSQIEAAPDLLRYYRFAWSSLAAFLTHHEGLVRRNPHNVLFTVLDKTTPGPFDGSALAGVVGLHADPAELAAEISTAIIFPAFHRTHVATNAVGVLQRWCLDLPSATPPGLGLRRVQWRALARNDASVRLAERMGFVREGTTRWSGVWPEERADVGEKPRDGDVCPGVPGRHTAVLACCWDNWEGGVRELVQKNIDRRA